MDIQALAEHLAKCVEKQSGYTTVSGDLSGKTLREALVEGLKSYERRFEPRLLPVQYCVECGLPNDDERYHDGVTGGCLEPINETK